MKGEGRREKDRLRGREKGEWGEDGEEEEDRKRGREGKGRERKGREGRRGKGREEIRYSRSQAGRCPALSDGINHEY